MLDKVRLARTGYDAYGETTDYKNYQGNAMPTWDELPDKIKEAWIASTDAVIKSHTRDVIDSLKKVIK